MRIHILLWWIFNLSSSTCLAQIQGNVYQDGNVNGTQEAFESSLSGIRMQAFNAQSELIAQSKTDSKGHYSLELAAGQAVLLQFSEIPKGLVPSQGSLVTRFLSAPATSNLGLYSPSLYAGASPQALQVLYATGDYTKSPTDTLATLVRFSALAPQGKPQVLATAKQTGSLWGLAYDRSHEQLFATSVAKRHSAFGPLGSGGIYRYQQTKGLQPWVSLENLGITTAPPNLFRDLSGDLSKPSHDSLFFAQIGKISLGGIDLSIDGKQLFVMNLYDQKLYQLAVSPNGSTPTLVKAFALPSPDTKTGVFRPWAVKMHQGTLYVGGVTDASISQQAKDLKA